METVKWRSSCARTRSPRPSHNAHSSTRGRMKATSLDMARFGSHLAVGGAGDTTWATRRYVGCRISLQKQAPWRGLPQVPAKVLAARADAGRADRRRPTCILRWSRALKPQSDPRRMIVFEAYGGVFQPLILMKTICLVYFSGCIMIRVSQRVTHSWVDLV